MRSVKALLALLVVVGAFASIGCGSSEKPAETAPVTAEVSSDAGTAPAVNMTPPDKGGVGTKGTGATGHGIDGR